MATCIWISLSDTSFSTNANWSNGTAPTTGDTIIFNGTGTANMTGGLNQSAVVFGEIIIDQANTVQIGSLTTAGVATYFQHAAPKVTIGSRTGNGAPAGSALLLLDSGATSCTYNILDTASTAAINTNLPPLQIKGSGLTINASGGNWGAAVRGGETSTVTATMAQGNGTTVTSPQAYLGNGVTITAFKMDAGNVLSRANNTHTTLTVNGGTYEHQGTGAATTANVNGSGTLYWSSTGTITTLNLSGTFDRTRTGLTATLTNTVLYKGAKLLLDNGVASSTVRTNAPTLSGCSMQDLTITAPAGELV